MGKKVREYKSGDFIFAKVKGYPAWPARVQRMNGKKYFVYFYGTGEIANLPPNMIFDYAENKEKFLNKTVKRKDFNDGVRQIEHDFANNVPLEQVIGLVSEEPAETSANDTANESVANETADHTTVADTTAADETTADDTVNTTQNDMGIEDSDEGALVIDEGKKGRKSKVLEATKTPAKPTPAKVAKEPKTPRGKAKKEEAKDKEEDDEKKEEELVSRSGRKIRPKRYMDEQTEENATLPAAKKRRAASPVAEKEKEKEKSEPKEVTAGEKNIKHYNTVTQSEIEYLKQPFSQEDPEKEYLLIAYLPNGQYVGIKLFQSRPTSFKNEASRLQWDKQAATNAITLKMQLEKGQIAPQSVLAQLEMELNLTDEEKASLDKEREIEEKKGRVQFLKTEMKLIELDAKIKTCLSLEKADTELCLNLLDELMELDVRPLMLLKHPSCLETVKRMRAYVGNTPSWDLSESAALVFSKQAHRIRTQANTLYRHMKELFTTPEGLSFWEYFSERVLQFKKITAKLTADELLEMVHEPLEMSVPTSHTMKSAIDAANKEENNANVNPNTNANTNANANNEDEGQKNKSTPVKSKKASNNNTPSKPPLKRQSSRKQQQQDEKEKEETKAAEEKTQEQSNETETNDIEKADKPTETTKEKPEKNNEKLENTTDKEKHDKSKDNSQKSTEKDENKDSNEENKNKESETRVDPMEVDTNTEVQDKDIEKSDSVGKDKTPKEDGKISKENVEEDKSQEKEESTKEGDNKKEKQQMDEPRAKRSRESKKTEPPPPRSPAKRKSKS